MIDKQLDKIEVLLLKISDDDQYKKDLYNEYYLYRSALETVPRDCDVPDVLLTSVESFEQRLKKYIIQGKSNNPLEELIPTLSSKIKSEEEKSKIIKLVQTNVSYLSNRRSQLDVLKSYLDGIDFDEASLEDIEAMIKYVEQGYIKTNVYSNSFEQEIAKAKYRYIIRLIYDNKVDKAEAIIKNTDTDMVLYLHSRHKETVKSLLDKGKSKLAMVINQFLTEFPDGKEKEVDFWKALCEIEHVNDAPKADIVVDEENSVVVNNEEKTLANTIEEDSIKPKKIGFFAYLRSIFNKNTIQDLRTMPRLISRPHYKIYINQNSVEITLHIYKFMMERTELEGLVNLLGKAYKHNNDAFLNVIVNIYDEYFPMMSHNMAELDEIIRGLTEYANITKMDWHCKGNSYTIKDGQFAGMLFKDLTIHKGTWEFGKDAFQGCFRLEKLNLRDTYIIHIGDKAFSNCSELKEVYLPVDSFEYMFGNGIFENCTNLTIVEWPIQIKKINKGTFKNCKLLKNLGTNSFEEIEASAFENCESFNNIFFSRDIKKIGAKAFYKCKSLTNFSFNDHCIIGDYAFAETGLTSVDVGFVLHEAGVGIFKGSMLHSATINKSLTLPNETFMDCKYLTRVKFDSFLSCICDDCFNGCVSIETLDISELVSYLGARAFMNCKNLRKIELNKACITIHEECFKGCASLTKFNVPFVNTIEKGLFYECVRLEEVNFLKPEDIIRIDDKAFELCDRLSQITIPPDVKSIGAYAFAGTDIKEAIIPESCREIGNGAFFECHRLERVQLSSYIRDIGDETFRRCFSLSEIDMSRCFIDSIGKQSFDKCESLRRISFGKGLRKAYKDSFAKCNMVEELVIPISLIGVSKKDLITVLNKDYSPVYEFMSRVGLYESYTITEIQVLESVLVVFIHSHVMTEVIKSVEE